MNCNQSCDSLAALWFVREFKQAVIIPKALSHVHKRAGILVSRMLIPVMPDIIFTFRL